MSREIKFRGFDKKNKCFCRNMSPEFIDLDEDIYSYYEDEGIIIMQFTGLLDKNGKEIYEGDVVKLNNALMNKDHKNWVSDCSILVEIKLNNYQASWEFFEKYGDIIGNIYENPDLIKGAGV